MMSKSVIIERYVRLSVVISEDVGTEPDFLSYVSIALGSETLSERRKNLVERRSIGLGLVFAPLELTVDVGALSSFAIEGDDGKGVEGSEVSGIRKDVSLLTSTFGDGIARGEFGTLDESSLSGAEYSK